MSEKKTYQVVLPPPLPPTKRELEREAFVLLLGELIKTHYHKYVAIHGGEVVSEGDDAVQVARDARARFGNVELYVGHVIRPTEREVVRMPSIRVVREGSR